MEGEIAVLIPIAFFAMIVAIVVMPGWLRSRDRQRLMDTVKTAYDRGQPVPPELIGAMQAPEATRSSPERDFRTGVVLIAVALAFIVLGSTISQVADEEEVVWAMTGIAAFPGLIGLAFLAFWLGKRGRSSGTEG